VRHWATRGPFFSVTSTADELSVVCPETDVPAGVRRRMAGADRAEGRSFSATGISPLRLPLAAAGVSICDLDHDTTTSWSPGPDRPGAGDPGGGADPARRQPRPRGRRRGGDSSTRLFRSCRARLDAEQPQHGRRDIRRVAALLLAAGRAAAASM
jgi:hypothetical protein